MRNQILVSGAVAALVSALIVVVLNPSGTPTTVQPDASTPAEPAAVAGSEYTSQLEERVAQLEAQIVALGGETGRNLTDDGWSDASESGDPTGSGSSSDGTGTENDALVENLSEDTAVRDAVGEVVREEMEYAREERWERRFERHAERRAEMVARFGSEQGLETATVERLDTMMRTEHETISDLFRQAREDGTWHEARDEAHALREETDEEIAGFLDGDQMEAWRQARDESSPHGRPRTRQ